jgi:glycosyltransferase involved in cell wall biosynthesis
MLFKISVIVPVFNVEHYLRHCLDSILNQTYPNLEVILINDGSTDGSFKICLQYLKKDSRIILLNKPNGGLSDARNAGLNVAKGDFISFIDSDDVLSSFFYQILIHNINYYQADVAECDFVRFRNNSELENSIYLNEGGVQIYDKEKALELLMREELNQVVWNKLYRRMVILDTLFPVNRINEDEFWTYKVFGNSKRIIHISEKLYFYRQQDQSIMGKQYSLKRLDGLQALEERITYMKEKFPKLENLAIKCFCLSSSWHYQQLEINKVVDTEKSNRKEILHRVKHFNRFSIIKNWKLKEIMWYQLFIWLPKCYLKLRESIEILSRITSRNEN